MEMIESWNNFIRIHGGETGARGVFEELMDALIREENPDKEVHLIQAAQGDGGIDVYVQQTDGIDVYQCKFFMDAMASSHWAQVKDSFDSILRFMHSDKARGEKLLTWFLCMPRKMRKEDIAKWDQFRKDRASYGIGLRYIDGNEIIQRLQKCDRQKGTEFINRYFTSHCDSIPKCLTPIPTVNRNVGLVGREDKLRTVINLLEPHGSMVLVSGVGGIGKTSLMQWACNEMKEAGKYVAWISCGSSLKDDLLMLGDALGISDDDRKNAYKMIIGKIKNCLYDSLYLFLDDLKEKLGSEELSDLNSLSAHIMATSRSEYVAFKTVELEKLEEDNAIKMFFRYYNGDTDRSYKEAARDIVTSVTRHTLLIELLAKAARKKGGTLADFNQSLKKEGVYDVFKRKIETAHDGNATIEDCILRLYEASHLTDEQKHILKLFTIFTPEKEIYYKLAEWAGFDTDAYADALDELVERGWLERAGLENNYRIHQIIRDSLQRQLKIRKEELKIEEYGNLLDKVADTNSYMPRGLEYTKVRERLTLTEDISNYLASRVSGMSFDQHISGEKKDIYIKAAMIFNNMADVFCTQGGYEKAMEYYKEALAIREQVLGFEHPDTATTYNNIAVVLKNQGKYKEAVHYLKKAITILKKVLETDHLDIARSYNYMGVVLRLLGEYKDALQYYEKALTIRESKLGYDHPDTAEIYNNMAVVYQYQENMEKALEYYGKAMIIREQRLGYDHPDTAVSYNNMALVYDLKGDHKSAFHYFSKALTIRERVFGTEHPLIAATYNHMALAYLHQGNYKNALEYNRKALSIREHVFGLNHPIVGTTYNNMGDVYKNQGEYDKALACYKKALAIRESTLGPDHPNTGITRDNIASVYELLKEYENTVTW